MPANDVTTRIEEITSNLPQDFVAEVSRQRMEDILQSYVQNMAMRSMQVDQPRAIRFAPEVHNTYRERPNLMTASEEHEARAARLCSRVVRS